ncbi:MAG TPA: nuclear transport factor 2 family protein [Gemmatimonadales bacterium]|nr:nuclear transport factor 2 family protein [Gemmatimonadales bacterium]
MPRAYGFTLLLAVATLSSHPAWAQVPTELQDAMRRRSQAVVAADAATWEGLTADDFTVVVADGTLLNKTQRLALLKKEKPRPATALQQEQVKHYGETYVRRFLGDRGWVLEIWTKDDAGKWRVSAVQVTTAAKK